MGWGSEFRHVGVVGWGMFLDSFFGKKWGWGVGM